jgi:DNA-binding Lrp family transcriptional regulator
MGSPMTSPLWKEQQTGTSLFVLRPDEGAMDRLDLGILRELSRDQIVWFGGLDPRLSAAEMARHLRVDRATVSGRLHAWERSGFLTGHAVVPSPLLFGAGVAGGNLQVEAIAQKPRILEDLLLVPGLISAVDHLGPWVALLFAYDSREALDRSRRLLERLAGVGEVSPCVPFHVPVPAVTPTSLDWRVLRGLSAAPRKPLGEVARSVGTTVKTLSRRLERLVAARAIWYLPLFDFSRYSKATIVRFVVSLRPDGDPAVAAEAAVRAIPGLSYLVDTSSLVSTEERIPPILDIGAHLHSVGEAEDIQRDLQRIDGVGEVEVLFPRRVYLYRAWFDERLETATTGDKRSPRQAGARVPHRGAKFTLRPTAL